MRVPDVIKGVVKELRNNMTKSEVILWNYLKWWKLWSNFLRQKPIYVFTENSWLDRFIIPDFYCFEKKLIIEIDWGIHNLKEIYNLDQEKEKLLKNQWFKILRITNNQINHNINTVLNQIKQYF
jgi:very-short-patch-repair endonuclease